MTLEQWRQDPTLAQSLRKLLNSGPLSEAIALAKDRGMPSSGDLKCLGPERVVLAAAEHDMQAGWHDCIRFILMLAMPHKEAIQHELPQQYDDEYVRKTMAKMGRAIPEIKTKKTK